MQLILILSPFVWRPPENAGVTSHCCKFLGPREGRGEAANSDFVPRCLATPENAGVTWHFRFLLSP